MRLSRAVLPLLMLGVAACGPAPDPQAEAKAKAAQDAAAADALAGELETQLSNRNWTLARSQCEVLAYRYPKSPLVARYAARCAEAKAQAGEQAEAARLQGLWSYQSDPVGKGRQLSTSIYSKDDVDTGAGRSRVRLIFRDHPEWGRSSYLVLENGDFDCYGGCALKMKVDGKPRSMAGSRPRTDEAIAMFIEDERGLWRTVRKAKTLAIDLPLKGARTQTVVFEVGGLDASRMPGW
ncbi:hypothetical protein [Cognatilysobacter segetis]|uniref:hypothetical protein n=1 Tax=Cognatilysobacter segetis TaxID=2492394 RepID=UPI00105DC7FB|nr:hypothetical protein [Lysobacter segetis]